MPLLMFPDRDALRLALTSSGVPSSLAWSPCDLMVQPSGRVSIGLELELTRELTHLLHRLGVVVSSIEGRSGFRRATCWAEGLIPVPSSAAPAAAVRIEAPTEDLANLTAEIQRCGRPTRLNLFDGAISLLHVEPWPTFSVAGRYPGYRLSSPRVWIDTRVEIPPLTVAVPAGRFALVSKSGEWRWFDDAGWSDLLQPFRLAETPINASRSDCRRRVSIPLRRIRADVSMVADWWILEDESRQRLEQLVQENSEARLSELEVSTTFVNGRSTVLLRSAAGTGAVGPIEGAQPYSRDRLTTDLVFPTGLNWSPQLRLDALRRLLPRRPGHTVVLTPHGESSLMPAVVAESSFAPLLKHVEYRSRTRSVLSPRPIQPVLPFEPFDQIEPQVVRPTPPPLREILEPQTIRREPWWRRWFPRLFRKKAPTPSTTSVTVDAAIRDSLPMQRRRSGETSDPRREEALRRRETLEGRLLNSVSVDQSQGPSKLLLELAAVYSMLGMAPDSAVCWLGCLWETPDAPDVWLWGWLQAERKSSRLLIAETDFDALLDAAPSPTQLRLLAAMIVWNARHSPERLRLHAGRAAERLDESDDWLPIRAAWLAHRSLADIAGGDLLRLARTRDRLSRRLDQSGLSTELDVPTFLRFDGRDVGDRLTLVRDWLIRNREPIHRWCDSLLWNRPHDYCRAIPDDYPDRDGRCTKAIVDYMMAWGLAQIGERTTAVMLVRQADDLLASRKDSVLSLLADAFKARIERAANPSLMEARFPEPVELRLEEMGRPGSQEVQARYRVDLLRRYSRILEPMRRIESIEATARDNSLGAASSLAEAAAIFKSPEPNFVLAAHHLEAALARAGAAHFRESFAETLTMIDRLPDPVRRVLLIAKAFNRIAESNAKDAATLLLPDVVRLFRTRTPRFGDLVVRMQSPRSEDETYDPEMLRRLEAFPAYCLRDLQSLGLGVYADALIVPAVEWILHGERIALLRKTQPTSWPSAMRALLRMAGTWFTPEHEDRAVTVLDAARNQLLYATDLSPRERGSLACSYATALTRAPIRMALGRLEELFQDLTDLADIRMSNSHFALSPLALVDAAIRAAVGDHFSSGPLTQRWLQFDELLVRSRIQQDLTELADDVLAD